MNYSPEYHLETIDVQDLESESNHSDDHSMNDSPEYQHECYYKTQCVILEDRVQYLEDKLIENEKKFQKRESDMRRNFTIENNLNLTPSPTANVLSPVRNQRLRGSELSQTPERPPKRQKPMSPNWDLVQSTIDDFAGREIKNGLKPNIVYFVIGMITYNALSYKQTSILLDVLNQTMPIFGEFLMNVKFPSKTSIYRVAQCIPVINTAYIIQRIENASNIVLAMDGSSKKGISYFAVILNDGIDKPYSLQAQRSCDGTALGEARLAISMLKDLYYIADKFNLTLKDKTNWLQNLFRKVSGTMADSCNTALAMKKEFNQLVREETGDVDQIITSLDCSMHYVGKVSH